MPWAARGTGPRSRGARTFRAAALAGALLLLGACGGPAKGPAGSGGAAGSHSATGAGPAGASGSGTGSRAAAPGPSAAGGSTVPGSLAALYARAKGETVTFAAAAPASDVQPVLARFRQTFPGVNVRYESQGDKVVSTDLQTQEAAGNVQIDLASDAAAYMPGLVPYMSPVHWPAGVQADPFLPSGAALHWFDTGWVVAYNTARVKPAEVPQTWQDLLRSRWGGGRIALNVTPTYADGLLLDPAWGRQKALAYAARLAGQRPLVEARPVLVLQAIVSGQADLGLTVPYLVLTARAHGQPVDIAPVSPQGEQHVDLFVPKGAPHPAGAELLAAWLVSAPARQTFEHASSFGLAAPCQASTLASYLCAKHVHSLYFATYRAETAAGPFERAFAAALGVRS